MQTLAATPRNGELGFWMAGLANKRPSYPRFTGQDSVDLAIIGGGYTGLWAAYFAKKIEPSLSVAVFEAEQIGYGASGRNGGWLSAMIPGNRATFARASAGGADASRALQQEFVVGVDSVLDILQAEGINADQHKGGALVAAHTKAGLGRLVTRREADLKYGLTEEEIQLLDRDEFQSRINISTVHGGLFYKHCARLQPAKLVYGLAGTLTSMGTMGRAQGFRQHLAPGKIRQQNGWTPRIVGLLDTGHIGGLYNRQSTKGGEGWTTSSSGKSSGRRRRTACTASCVPPSLTEPCLQADNCARRTLLQISGSVGPHCARR